MAKVKWLGCALMPPTGTTLLHTFPLASAEHLGSYSVNCRVTLFGSTIEPQKVLLEGITLQKPDGLSLAEIFSLSVDQSEGWFGAAVELLPTGRLVQLDASRAVFEVEQKGRAIKFRPRRVAGSDSSSSIPIVMSKELDLTLVIVNGSGQNHLIHIEGDFSLEESTILASKVVDPLAVRSFRLRDGQPSQDRDRVRYIRRPQVSASSGGEDVAYFLVFSLKKNQQPLAALNL